MIVAADSRAFFMNFLFSYIVFVVGISLFTIFSKSVIPNNAGPPVIAEVVKNNVVANKLLASFDTFFAFFAALSNSFLFLFNKIDSDNIDLFFPIKISLNFSIIFFRIILLTPHPILFNDFTSSGAELIILITLDNSSLSIFSFPCKSSIILDTSFSFILPTRISLRDIFLRFPNALISEDKPPSLFLLMLFAIAFATISDALSLNFATAGIALFFCFKRDFERLSIAFLIPFVSSRISLMCL